ncbi:metallophosphoesterase family protein [Veillonella criceti]|uniref:Calcineurin-like phosphoesterase domain-containing protein n=1 Tax=Veillonella criceti TaxID=103891 RepID=A0A380NJA0_9FIRM|nr:metallophosphoesterase [Veillonella criceti]SUP41105.1 Uncharacterised protein [Veillonella criceti]
MLYITGDLHGDKSTIRGYLDTLKETTKDDILIIAGDFGLPWWSPLTSYWKNYKDVKLLKLLADGPFTTCFIDGNHENFNQLAKYPLEEKWGGLVQNIEGCYHLMRGEIYTMETSRIFTFGGATSTDKEWRTPKLSWWPQEVCSEEERIHAIDKLNACNWEVDYVITHTAPKQFKSLYKKALSTKNEPCETADFLTEIYKKIIYKCWYFGHFHDDISDNNLKARLIYNDIVEMK